ncbi:LysM peptidoglycan-binding domain-containing protein [Alphaproteobacteria bacterium KMM 3653]|uniref:LysM peptidoglycan-binding domain-containing protein n=1 Tax=Harenicola maris TaxID=2841044 RepID=A0AAP2CNT3_9RHOB|nr:LysM peptidoglycan-binding domain-containing protein [Harenicola maris]
MRKYIPHAMWGSLVLVTGVLVIWQPGAISPEMAVTHDVEITEPAAPEMRVAEAAPAPAVPERESFETAKRAVPDATRPLTPSPELNEIIKRALEEGMSRSEIERILGTSLAAGDVEVPPGLMTAEGEIDTGTMVEAMGSADEGDEIQLLTEAQSYTVQPGDSLARIALIYYGDPYAYPRIFAANEGSVERPDLIYAGQVLVIPAAVETQP